MLHLVAGLLAFLTHCVEERLSGYFFSIVSGEEQARHPMKLGFSQVETGPGRAVLGASC
jgi:hypothetical protein